LAACALAAVRALKMVLLPTLGRPTIPQFKGIPKHPFQLNGRGNPLSPVGRLLNFHEVGEISASRKSAFLRSDQSAVCIRRHGLQKTYYYYAEKKGGVPCFLSQL
jgi:hypothetical protein